MGPAALATAVIHKLKDHGHQAFLVGGCVRDLLRGEAPKDFDVSTDATPDRVRELFENSKIVGAKFGVVLVRHESGDQVEVATFRSDFDYEDGRRPSRVHFEVDPRADVLRRDFTINGIMMDPDSGEVLDFVDGQSDLRRRTIRAIGDPEHRFREDQLRMLRAVRFAARLGFEIEAGTLAAIRKLSASIHTVSAERVHDELVRILTEGGARRGFELLDESGLLVQILPEIARMKGVEQPPQFHPEGDVWTHTLMMLDGLGKCTATLALGVLLHDVGKPPTFRIAERIRFDGHVQAGVEIARQILNRLRFSAAEIEQVEQLVANHMKFVDVPRMRQSTLKRFLRLPRFEEHMALHRLDCLSSHGDLTSHEIAQTKLEEMPAEVLKPLPLLTGRDLIEAGYKPGPEFSRMLALAEDAQLEGRVHTREEALALIEHTFPEN